MALLSFEDMPKQAEFVFSPDKLTAYFGKIRAGKTVAGCARILMLAELYPGNELLVGRKTYPDLWNTTAKELLGMVAKRNGGNLLPGPYLEKWVQSNSGPDFQTIFIKTQGEPSKIRLRYADDVGSMLGGEWGGFFLDQIEEIDDEVYTQVVNRLTYWNIDRVAEFKRKYGFEPKSFGFVTGNPDPGWAYEEFKINALGKYHFIETTIEENSRHLPKGYFDELARNNPPSWVDRYLNNDWSVKGGQIYKEFDERIHVIEPFAIPHHWPRFLGMDYGYSHPSAIYWGALDERGVFYFYRELFVSGRIASEIAADIKTLSKGDPVPMLQDHILVYMPADMNKHDGIVNRTVQQEFALYGIQGLKANQSVEAGILKFQERLHNRTVFIFKGKCPALIKGMKTYVRDEVTEKPVKKDDDACLVARTMIETNKGLKPIEQMQAGDMVKTRRGYHKVLMSWKTGIRASVKVKFSNGAELTGTGNHPVWIENYGFVPIDALRYGMVINNSTSRASWLRSLFIKGIGIAVIPIRAWKEAVNTFRETTREGLNCFTAEFGKIIMDQSQKETMSITSTVIQGTMQLKISNVFPQRNTPPGILSFLVNKEKIIYLPSENLLSSGTEVQKVERGTANILLKGGLIGQELRELVNNVEKFMSLNNLKDFAPMLASLPGGVKRGWIILKRFVVCVSRVFRLISICGKIKSLVPVFVVNSSAEGSVEVYNLTVETEHEYYANGILVSNCDGARYTLVSALEQKADGIPTSKDVDAFMESVVKTQLEKMENGFDPD